LAKRIVVVLGTAPNPLDAIRAGRLPMKPTEEEAVAIAEALGLIPARGAEDFDGG